MNGSKLPIIVGSGSPSKSPKKTLTPKRSPRKSVTISEKPPEEIPTNSYDPNPVQDSDNLNPNTPQGVSIAVPRSLPLMSPVTHMTPKRVLSSIPEGDEGNDTRIET